MTKRQAAAVQDPDEVAAHEKRLMQATQDDPANFAPLYEAYFSRIYGYCLRRLSQPQEAEDVTSQVFIRALAAREQYRGGSVAAWLFRIAHNTLVNHLRGRRQQVSLDAAVFEVSDDRPSPIERLVQAEEHERLRALVAALPEDQQDVLALKLVAGLNSQEIGEVLGKSPGAVRVEIHRIIKKLRARYEGGAQ